jgi:hypothetical protein
VSAIRGPGRWALALVRGGKPFGRVAASRAIVGRNRSRVDPTAGRFTHRDVVRFLDDAFERFEREVPGLPGEPTVGSRQNVMLAALTLSLLEVLEKSGVERDYAIELTGDTCWRFYRHWGRITKTVTSLASRDPTCAAPSPITRANGKPPISAPARGATWTMRSQRCGEPAYSDPAPSSLALTAVTSAFTPYLRTASRPRPTRCRWPISSCLLIAAQESSITRGETYTRAGRHTRGFDGRETRHGRGMRTADGTADAPKSA